MSNPNIIHEVSLESLLSYSFKRSPVTIYAPIYLVGILGLEPRTPTVSAWYSNQLSYMPIYVDTP